MTGAQIKEKLHSGERVYGTHIVSLMNPLAAAIATGLELDFAFFCTEHMPIDRTETAMMCQFYKAHGISPIVRVPDPNPTAISMATDGGAEGIVVPYVETLDEVQRIVAAVKHRPIKGKLRDEVIAGRESYSPKLERFLEEFNKDQYVIIGVESVAAIENLDTLIKGTGVDGVFLGPHDITTSMGIPEEYDNPLFVDAVLDVIRRCRAQQIGVGLHFKLLQLQDDILQRLLDAGMNWILNGSDVTILRDTMNAQLGQIRHMAGDVPYGAAKDLSAERTDKTCIE